MSYQHFGNQVAGWWVDTDPLSQDSIIYSAGLGVDITFELELTKTIGCKVCGFDPTPGATQEYLKQYQDDRLIFEWVGLAGKDRNARFCPLHPGWATFTENTQFVIQKSGPDKEVEVPLKSLFTLLSERKHNHIDLLKIDIEGTEYEVIKDVFFTHKGKVPITQFLVEWHEPLGNVSDARIQAEFYLEKAGYVLGYEVGTEPHPHNGVNSSYVFKGGEK